MDESAARGRSVIAPGLWDPCTPAFSSLNLLHTSAGEVHASCVREQFTDRPIQLTERKYG